ncbi:MAG: GNAT family N-acetyltransferase [Sphingobacteriia bacterium]|nr:GNAT family N-acetyltransferase [Sphingobacteriia bacterium]
MEQYRILNTTDLTPEFFNQYKTLIKENFRYIFTSELVNNYIETFNLSKLSQIIQNQGLLAIYEENNYVNGLILCTPQEGGVGTIIWLVVNNNCRHKGIGKNLFTMAEDHYKAIKCHKIKLTAPSEEVVNFYKKIGMQVEGFHPNHWYNKDFWSLGIVI